MRGEPEPAPHPSTSGSVRQGGHGREVGVERRRVLDELGGGLVELGVHLGRDRVEREEHERLLAGVETFAISSLGKTEESTPEFAGIQLPVAAMRFACSAEEMYAMKAATSGRSENADITLPL
jgi:hypothetical protein